MLIRASQLYESSGACKVNQREPHGPKWNIVKGSMNENANSRLFYRVRDLNTCPRVSRMFHFQINKLQRRLAMSSSCSQSYLFSLRVLHVFKSFLNEFTFSRTFWLQSFGENSFSTKKKRVNLELPDSRRDLRQNYSRSDLNILWIIPT